MMDRLRHSLRVRCLHEFRLSNVLRSIGCARCDGVDGLRVHANTHDAHDTTQRRDTSRSERRGLRSVSRERRTVDPDAFLVADKASRPPNRFPDADVFPPFAQATEHDCMLLLTPDGPCEMYFFHTRWGRRADVRAWGKELRSHKACGTVFSRDIAR